MGTVAVTLQVMPASPDANLERIKEAIRGAASAVQDVKLQSIEEKPIAFGLKALSVLLLMPDAHGTDAIEKALAAIPDVESVEAGDVTLV
ncbi:MAG: elongation factor 1-beta [Candidatus Aenigmarchaeota archaeon]|nr:elongation factor 1-beta [Candidatus Aenigmarchaeota archaeon]